MDTNIVKHLTDAYIRVVIKSKLPRDCDCVRQRRNDLIMYGLRFIHASKQINTDNHTNQYR